MAETHSVPPKQKNIAGQYVWWLLMLFFVYLYVHQATDTDSKKIDYSSFKQQVETGQIAQVVIKGQDLWAFKEKSVQPDTRKSALQTILPAQQASNWIDWLEQHDIAISILHDKTPVWVQILVGFLPWILIMVVFIYSSRALRDRMGSGMGGGGPFSFSRSKARRFDVSRGGPKYADIAGLENAKHDLAEIIDYLKQPEKYQRLGAEMPKGMLLMGPPGTGKTLLAKATAAEAGVPFFAISGSEFIEMFVGVGASRVRDMFKQARAEAPALIFIDEIDSVGRVRGTGMGGGNDEREQTLNQILAEMDGFDPNETVVVIAATNRPDVLDPALMRPGRFDRKVILELPHKSARLDILNIHARHVPLQDGVDLAPLAAETVGFSGADLHNLINEAALHAAHDNRDCVIQEDLHQARDKVVMGDKREDLLNPSERERIACHEAGHALVAFFSLHSDPVNKVSIVPRGRSLGMTEQRPSEDRHNIDEDFLKDRLTILLAGRSAERQRFGTVSTGAADDLKQATQLARKMVAQWGMGKTIGPMSLPVAEEHPFLGREIAQAQTMSEATAQKLDDEVLQLLQDAEARCKKLLKEKQAPLEKLITSLLHDEAIEQEKIKALLDPE